MSLPFVCNILSVNLSMQFDVVILSLMSRVTNCILVWQDYLSVWVESPQTLDSLWTSFESDCFRSTDGEMQNFVRSANNFGSEPFNLWYYRGQWKSWSPPSHSRELAERFNATSRRFVASLQKFGPDWKSQLVSSSQSTPWSSDSQRSVIVISFP
jgi:hypothetical protein